MAIITTEGMLQIDLADVYVWLGQAGYTKNVIVKSMAFSTEEDALVLERDGNDPIYVDATDLWTWVIDRQLPKGIEGHETVFGVPTVRLDDGHFLQITFASSNESDPRDWARPPACLAEWKTKPADPATLAVLKPPAGHASWLDYAIATMDVRSAQLSSMEETDGDAQPSYDAMRAAAKAELAALRPAAA